MKLACLLTVWCLAGCAFEDFVDTARTDSYHLEGKGIPSEHFELLSLPVGRGHIEGVHVQRASTPGPTILFCHGASANIETSWARAIVWYELGFDAVLFDYRGFGASSGSTFSEDSLYDDAQRVLTHVLEVRGVNRENVVVYGHSLGGPVAAELALRTRPAALVLESTFTSLHAQIQSDTYFDTPDSFFSDFVLDTKHISRYHAVLLAGPVNTSIEDLNSTNGVFVNGKRVTRQVLNTGDKVTIGKTQFRYTVRD